MNCSLGNCIFCLGAGLVAGAMIASNNTQIRKWFSSSTQKITEFYDDIMQKVDTKLGECTCSSQGNSSSGSSESSEKEGSSKNKKSN